MNIQPADNPSGENYGWRLREGTIATPTPLPPDTPVVGDPLPGASDPIYEYAHSSQVPFRSITGGFVACGPIAELEGRYCFTDFSTASEIYRVVPEPASGLLVGVALTAIAAVRRRVDRPRGGCDTRGPCSGSRCTACS